MTYRLRMLMLASAAVLFGATRADADLLAVENGANDVLRFDAAGNRFTFANTNLDSPIGINADSAGNVYVVNQGATATSTFTNSVAKFSSTGTPQGFFITPATSPGNTLNAPYDIAFDNSNNAYVTNQSQIVAGYVTQYSGAPNGPGVFQNTFGTTYTNVPTGIGLNPSNGLLYIVNSGTGAPNPNSFAIVNPANLAAAPTIITPTGLGTLDGGQQVTFDQNGNVFIASFGSTSGISRVQEYNAAGTYIQTVATTTAGAEGVAYDKTTNTLYVSYVGPAVPVGSQNFPNGFIEKYSVTGNTSADLGILSAAATNLNGPTYLLFQPTAVPEPGSVVLMGLGLVAMVGYRVRRAKNAA